MPQHTLRGPAGLQQVLRGCFERRRCLLSTTEVWRWVDGEIENLVVEVFGRVAVAGFFAPWTGVQKEALWAAMQAVFPLEAIWEKHRPKEAHILANTQLHELAPASPSWGVCAKAFGVEEEGLCFEIRPSNGLSVGLYVDARKARRFIRAHSKGKRVLNLFAYTCGFGVAARSGGAVEVLNVDISKHCLEWGKQNLERNGFEAKPGEFWVEEVFRVLGKLFAKGRRFELIILDPPSFSNVGKRRLRVADDYIQLTRMCTQLLEAQGLLLAMCNARFVGPGEFSKWVYEGFGRRGGYCEEHLGVDIDCRQPSWLKAEVWRKLG
ncbi:MAG: class I SAM-dependent methyltransferase [Proteobacteria bacterium]|nr:class I SAM-dependent methyltransferase [Cystobacterineae bacterium]MCL2314360.1 class I SAM-dependent methyltransferase [Pseudomonadota bacterium]